MSDTFGRGVQSRIYLDGVSGRRPRVPTDARRLEEAARRKLSARAWAYVAGSSGTERTARANREAFERRRIVPRMLRDVAERDLTVELFGRRHPAPLLTAPIGVLDLAHPDADLGVAQAASALGIPFIASNQASVPLEDTAEAVGGSPHWFQLYWSSSDELVASLVGRAERAGAEAIVVTLDTHSLGWRPRDLDLAYLPFAEGRGIAQYTSDPVFQRLVAERASRPAQPSTQRITPAAVATLVSLARNHPGPFAGNLRSLTPRVAVQTFLDVFSRPSLTWEDLAFLRGLTALPIVLKGIQHPDDARRAVDAGIDGVLVSNHGGRQVDGAVAALDMLPPWSRRSAPTCRCCSTAASARAPMCSSRSPWAPVPSRSAARACTAWRWRAPLGWRRCCGT
ncbi:oxidoreductase [Naasia aerilata]|uniref:Oxidoreductase n=1 Tax=Naasia aerilata TaxID=1162966 RepID=A0ABM8G9C5_9MICO|nr:oxidoreductase [Naasia aerilata]